MAIVYKIRGLFLCKLGHYFHCSRHASGSVSRPPALRSSLEHVSGNIFLSGGLWWPPGAFLGLDHIPAWPELTALLGTFSRVWERVRILAWSPLRSSSLLRSLSGAPWLAGVASSPPWHAAALPGPPLASSDLLQGWHWLSVALPLLLGRWASVF